jgi:hypothetical protein
MRPITLTKKMKQCKLALLTFFIFLNISKTWGRTWIGIKMESQNEAYPQHG